LHVTLYSGHATSKPLGEQTQAAADDRHRACGPQKEIRAAMKAQR
jgi:hypothetical protein